MNKPYVRTCSTCEAPARIIWISHLELAEYGRALAEWNAKVDAHNVGSTLRVLDWSLLEKMPEVVPWQVCCLEHAPVEGNPYELNYPTEWAEWLDHTAHLMEKSWLKHTSWGGVLRDVAHRAMPNGS